MIGELNSQNKQQNQIENPAKFCLVLGPGSGELCFPFSDLNFLLQVLPSIHKNSGGHRIVDMKKFGNSNFV